MSERQRFEVWWAKKHEADPNSKQWRVLADLDWEVWRAGTESRSGRRPLFGLDLDHDAASPGSEVVTRRLTPEKP